MPELAHPIEAGEGGCDFAQTSHVAGKKKDGPFGPYGSRRRDERVRVLRALSYQRSAIGEKKPTADSSQRDVREAQDALPTSLSEQVELGRPGGGGGARGDPQLAQDVGHVAVDSVLAQDEAFCDLLVAHALRDEL